jgi:O-antigen/teichoic acid export membrane protein
MSVRRWIKERFDPQTRGFARDSSKLAVGSFVTIGSYAAQIALITHFLGLGKYGVFAVVVSVVDVVGRLFDFQVGQMTQAFAAETVRSDPRRTVGIAQFSYLIDVVAGIISFLVVAASAPLIATSVLDGKQGPGIFIIYALTLLATTTQTTSVALLQLAGRFGSIVRLTLVRELLRCGLILAAVLATHSLLGVVIVLVVMESLMAIMWTATAARATSELLGGTSVWHPSLSATKGMRREMAGTVFHTNVISYVKILASQGPTILLGAMRSPAEVGAFKVAMAISAVVGKPADPAWAAVLPRFAKLRAQGGRREMISLIRQTSIVALAGMSLLGIAAILFRNPLLRLFGGAHALTAGPVVILGVLASVINGALFWNSPLLFALKRARGAAAVFVAASLVFVPVLVLSIDRWGATGAAAALLLWNVIVNAGLSVVAIRSLRLVSAVSLPLANQAGMATEPHPHQTSAPR